MSAETMVFECENGHVVTVDAWDKQEVGEVWCHCVRQMELVRIEDE